MIKVLFIAKIKHLTPEYEEYNNILHTSVKKMNGFIGIDSEVVNGKLKKMLIPGQKIQNI